MQQTRIILSTVIAVSLFLGGIALLFSHISFWSYFLGLPAAQIGIIMLIINYEKLSKKSTNEKIEDQMLKEKNEEDE